MSEIVGFTTEFRTSPSHQRYIDAGCVQSREELGKPNPTRPTMIHFYGLCSDCGTEMHDVNEYGYEECLESPHFGNRYGGPDYSRCVRCVSRAYIEATDLTDRQAKCTYRQGRDGKGHRPVASSWSLAFFEHKPSDDFDSFYCGCWGWD